MSDSTSERSGKVQPAARRSFVVIGLWGVVALLVSHFRQGWAPVAQPNFQSVSPRAWSVVLFCVAVAALTMGFVQICRMIVPLRGIFHRQSLERWLETAEEHKSEATPPVAVTPPGDEISPGGSDAEAPKVDTAWEKVLKVLEIEKPNVDLAIAEFEERRGARSERKTSTSSWSFPPSMSLYDLPIEQLSGQLNLAFEAALDDPKHFKNFILLTVGREGADNLLTIVQPMPTPPISRIGPDADTFEAEMVSRGQSRSSISRTSQLRIDMFQISAGGRWRFLLRSAVLMVSIALSFAILFTTTADFEIHGITGTLASFLGVTLNLLFSLGYALIFGSISAYLAMFLRDLAAIVENKRRRTS